MPIHLGPTEHIDQPEALSGYAYKLHTLNERQRYRQHLTQEFEPHRRRLDDAGRRSPLPLGSRF